MKIRIKGNSIRVRISQNEFEQLGVKGKVMDETNFGNKKFTYGIVVSDSSKLTSTFIDNSIVVKIPHSEFDHWKKDDLVGLYYNLDGSKNEMAITVEKDFQCLKPREFEDETDLYANPLATEI